MSSDRQLDPSTRPPEKVGDVHLPGQNTLKKLLLSRPQSYHLLLQMAELMVAKGHDYSGAQKDNLENIRASRELGIEPWKGCLLRMGDKWARIRNFALQGLLKVKDESFEDTLLDLAVYALIAIQMWREAKNEKEGEEVEK